MKRRIITLLTDFGSKDPYVASMKGVILNINPGCTLVDLTHQISPHNVREGAFILAQAFATFPRGTIHLGVVDPEVGSPRKPILCVTKNYFFVGPDNGLFTIALRTERPKQVIHLANEKFFLPRISSTFHGRDIFAPVAAHLSLGIKPRSFGPVLNSWQEISFPEPVLRHETFSGEVIHIDAFGNLVSNIDRERLVQFSKGRPVAIRAGKRVLRGLKRAYWEARKKEPVALIGSGGFLEIAVREGNAEKVLKLSRGDRIVVERGK